jgi:hypothetical protein
VSSLSFSIDLTDPRVQLQHTVKGTGQRLDYLLKLVATNPGVTNCQITSADGLLPAGGPLIKS